MISEIKHFKYHLEREEKNPWSRHFLNSPKFFLFAFFNFFRSTEVPGPSCFIRNTRSALPTLLLISNIILKGNKANSWKNNYSAETSTSTCLLWLFSVRMYS